ncbi:MAG: LCP family protein [Ethanoligenens sp.]
MSGTRAKKRFHWWFIPIAVVVVLAISISAIYAYTSSRIHKNIKYVKNWSQVTSTAQDNTSSAQQGLDQIDAGNFPGGNSKDYPIIQVKQKDPNIENILLVGIDATQGNGGEGSYGANRADSIMVLSVNKKTNTLKIASLLRDTKTYFPNTQSNHKLNAAFSYGGIGLQIDVVNYAYKLDIQKYMEFDFDGFSHIIDTVGGVPITLTAKEASYSYINVGTQAGTYTLDGAHALGYTRTRKIDTDFMRTQRQRNVMMAIYNKFKSADMLTKISVLNQCTGYFKTNIPTTELTGTLMSFESGLSNIQQISIPTEDDGMYTTETSPIWFWDLNWPAEVGKLQSYIYGS